MNPSIMEEDHQVGNALIKMVLKQKLYVFRSDIIIKQVSTLFFNSFTISCLFKFGPETPILPSLNPNDLSKFIIIFLLQKLYVSIIIIVNLPKGRSENKWGKKV